MSNETYFAKRAINRQRQARDLLTMRDAAGGNLDDRTEHFDIRDRIILEVAAAIDRQTEAIDDAASVLLEAVADISNRI